MAAGYCRVWEVKPCNRKRQHNSICFPTNLVILLCTKTGRIDETCISKVIFFQHSNSLAPTHSRKTKKKTINPSGETHLSVVCVFFAQQLQIMVVFATSNLCRGGIKGEAAKSDAGMINIGQMDQRQAHLVSCFDVNVAGRTTRD